PVFPGLLRPAPRSTLFPYTTLFRSRLACTTRAQVSVEQHALGALMATRDGALHQVEPRELHGIVDRIGGGDAFAAGVLHGLASRSEEHTSELQSRENLVCRLLLEKK